VHATFVLARGNLFQRTGEPLSVAFSVANAVFALTVRLVLRRGFYAGTAFARVRMVRIDIVYVNPRHTAPKRAQERQKPWEVSNRGMRSRRVDRNPSRRD
jgi:hypothetical protein